MRARIVLMAAEGHDVRAIARKLHVAPATVRLWCDRFEQRGLAALVQEAPGRGRKRGMRRPTVVRVLRSMLEVRPPARGWTARSLAAQAGTSAVTVWRVWKRYDVGPASPPVKVRGALGKLISETPPDAT